LTPERQTALNELGALDAKLAPHREALKREESLRKQVRTWCEADKVPAGQSKAYDSGRYVATLGPRATERRIGCLAAVYKTLGKARFVRACSMTLKALEAEVPETAAQFIVSEASGSRTLIIAATAAALGKK
jgi:phage host-nuclease inhibitor protein Gam